MEKNRLKIKTMRKKINVKKIIIFLIILMLIYFGVKEILSSRIKNIYVINNNVIGDRQILEELNIIDYPSFYGAILKINKRVDNKYIKDIRIKKKMWNKLYIYVSEYKYLCIYNDKIMLENGSLVDNKYNIDYVPYVLNDITTIYDEFVSSFSKIDDDILYRISEIKYDPVSVDNERFLLYMIDGNIVYITLSKINKYDTILQKMGERNGVIYLDSGDYVDVKV